MLYLVSYISREDIYFLKNIIKENDIIVAVDQGCKLLLDHNISPDYLIGDLDSFNIADYTMNDQIKIIKLNKEKDESDLEYALNYFKDTFNVICIVNNMQDRLDHILTTLFLLDKQCNDNKLCIMNHKETIRILDKNETLHLVKETLLSLVPLSEKVVNVTCTGLYYKLNNDTLYRNSSRGLSNIVKDSKVNISYDEGKLLVILQNSRNIYEKRP